MTINIKNTNLLYLTLNYKNIYNQILVLKTILNEGWIEGVNDISGSITNHNYPNIMTIVSYINVDGKTIRFIRLIK